MAVTLEELQVLITAKTGDLTRELARVENNLKGLENNTRTAAKGISGGLGGISKAAVAAAAAVGGTALAVRAAVGAGKACIDLGSDLAEVQNVVDVTFGSMSKRADEFAKNAIEGYGLSETAAKKYMGVFGAMNKAYGFTTEKSYEMAEAVTALTGDVASFYNLSSDAAYTKLKSIWTGETESLKDLGVVMTQNALDQYALANEYGKVTAKMTEAEKVTLRYKFVQDKLSAASGDFMRTSDGWANQVRVLSLRFDSLKASIGQALIPMLTPAVRSLNILISKIQMAVEYFNRLISAFTGKKQADGLGEAAKAAGDVKSSMDGMGDKAAEGAAETEKAAKKVKKALTGLDEINVLSFKEESGDGGDDTGGMEEAGIESVIDEGAIDEADTVFDKIADRIKAFVDDVKKELERLRGIFEKGFKIGLGNGGIDVGAVKNALKDIKIGFDDIFGDGEIGSAVKGLIDSAALSMGKVVGAFVSVGNTIGENIIGGMGLYLKQNSGYIKERLLGILDSAREAVNQMGDFAVAFADVFTVFRGDTAKQITADIIGIYGNAFLGVIDLFGRLNADIFKLMTEPFIRNKDIIKAAVENTLAPVRTVTGAVSRYVTESFEKVFEVYEEYVSPAFEEFTEGVTKLQAALLTAYNDYFAPVMGRLAEKLADIYDNSLRPLTDKVLVLIGKIIGDFGKMFNECIAPALSWFINMMAPVIADTLEYIAAGVLNFAGTCVDYIEGVIDVFTGLYDFLAGVFTGNMGRTMKGLVEMFKGMTNQIAAVINGLIGAINSIQFTIPKEIAEFFGMKEMGGKAIGFDIPKIPKLARGGIIDKPIISMLGEDGREAVVPLENNTGGLDLLAERLLEGMQGQRTGTGTGGNIELTVKIGEDQIIRKIIKGINRESTMQGRSVLI